MLDPDTKTRYTRLFSDEIAKRLFWYALVATAGLIYLWWNRSGGPVFALAGYVLAAAIAATWIAISIYNRRSYKRPHYPSKEFKYELLSKKISYRVVDNVLTFSRRIRLRALTDNVDSYIDRFVWTGGEAGLPNPGEGVESLTHLTRAGIWTIYETRLDETIHKGQEIEFEVIWPPIDNWRNSRPFVSSSTEEPCREMTFVLEIPQDSLYNDTVYAEEMRGIEAHYPFRSHRLQFDNGRLTYTFKTKLYWHYRLRWAWSGTEEAPDLTQTLENRGNEE